MQEFEKTFDFVNSHLLKGVATMAELTKVDNRQPMGKIKPTDKMVMMPSVFDGTKPATSKQHYERFNLYINFQTKSGHLTDPVGEAIDLFKHTLDKTALVWFQTNRSKFKDLTKLKMMFLQRYNPWGKTKREQLQSWNILSFNPKTTDVDEHIDLINTLGGMVDQKEEAKKEKFIETVPTMIQTHLTTCKDWAMVKDTAKSLEHIIMKCDPPTLAMPMMATGATVPGLYSIGRSRGCHWHTPSQQDQFLLFLHTFLPKSVRIRGWHPPMGWCPPMGNPGSTTVFPYSTFGGQRRG